ncbi:cryptochrome/photolyase family protein [Pleionea sediminis]|uniref:cryptochrome/photolyase family protein n=1 Tax=Pleionea sediminis TaxID=2569479 RepID=UPI0011851D12|nr:cryptochrome/photolyase family protein [Pleionea sediminis]
MKPIRSIGATLNKSTSTLRLILGDQLNANHSWFRQKDSSIVYLIAELKQETSYVKHHKQKVLAFFSAMKEFAFALAKSGHQVIYLTLDETHLFDELPELLKEIIRQYDIEQFHYQQPDEYRLANQLQSVNFPKVKKTRFDSEHFLLQHDEISDYFDKEKKMKMEFFYRKIRKRFQILMDNNQPVGGKWNYDHDNRNSFTKDDLKKIPKPLLFTNDVRPILKRIEKHNVKTMGECSTEIIWPINRKQARQLLAFFCENLLPHFGQFQDAMTENSPYRWSLYHSRLSFALNSKMLSPMEVINTSLEAWEHNKDSISLAQIEGFVRQIVGWREFVRGIYWANAPDYASLNYLSANRQLPDYFWTAETKMNCIKQVVSQSLDYAYAHHIQRLMVTGNFCLLTGIHPDEVDEWYLGIYVDALEWVEMPNTRGMTQFADAGILATKPYCSSGSYINKMSDYCKNCDYSVSKKTEAESCPFNSLYWNFIEQHKDKFNNNPRMRMIYMSWNKMSHDKQQALIQRAQWCLNNISKL